MRVTVALAVGGHGDSEAAFADDATDVLAAWQELHHRTSPCPNDAAHC